MRSRRDIVPPPVKSVARNARQATSRGTSLSIPVISHTSIEASHIRRADHAEANFNKDERAQRLGEDESAGARRALLARPTVCATEGEVEPVCKSSFRNMQPDLCAWVKSRSWAGGSARRTHKLPWWPSGRGGAQCWQVVHAEAGEEDAERGREHVDFKIHAVETTEGCHRCSMVGPNLTPRCRKARPRCGGQWASRKS